MNNGRIEQAGPPVDLYENPASEFVMGFIGPVNKVGDSFIRPHDLEILIAAQPNAQKAKVTRIVHLGFEIRVELVLEADEKHVWAQITKEQLAELELEEGQTCWMRPRQQRSFNGTAEHDTAEQRLAAT
jgi:sulfate transport system ATP-binding protein